MIDTLARHIAALREARRLTLMVLANNGSFAGLQRAMAAQDAGLAAQFETELAGDKVYCAYMDLTEALAQIVPGTTTPPSAGGDGDGRLADKISLLRTQQGRAPHTADAVPKANGARAGETAEPAAPCRMDAPATGTSLGERLNRVLEMTAMAGTEAAAPVAAWAAQHDEARVAIVYRDASPAPFGVGEGSRPGFVSLLR